ncbi:hypothetical protein [Nostoc sp. DedQUE09]|uniref:hypothetical protein n=1 Tax=Nostoc sp. DedQUE09 TaxID=3075394 RepID=UPI002AD539AB|nr:hypothetical protein [Nostoc sp. DedQUE09]MDZ7954180.1 hypothetical protein [Nostoc sp. DedQUE09]
MTFSVYALKKRKSGKKSVKSLCRRYRGKKLPKKQPSQETLEAIAQKIKTFLQTGHFVMFP